MKHRTMEAVAASHGLWSSPSRGEACSSIARLRLQGFRITLRSCNLPRSAIARASLRSGIGAASRACYDRFSIKSPRSLDRSRAYRASGPSDNNGETSSEEEDTEKGLDSTPTVRNDRFSNTGTRHTDKDDWRAFRARLVVGEQADSTVSTHQSQESLQKSLNKKWAHPIPFPETGCLLVATDKLDGQAPFERSVILLLRLGSAKPQDGPFGVILNRPILHMAKDSEPITDRMAQMLSSCRLFYGGPLPADIFLLMQNADGFNNLEEIMPGVHYGYAHGLHQVADLTVQDKILSDFRFYVGYAGWDYNQLKHEIAEGFWWLASCSPDLIKEVQSDELWQEVLTSMGGKYAELGRNLRGDML